jgi:hypothetical protein
VQPDSLEKERKLENGSGILSKDIKIKRVFTKLYSGKQQLLKL